MKRSNLLWQMATPGKAFLSPSAISGYIRPLLVMQWIVSEFILEDQMKLTLRVAAEQEKYSRSGNLCFRTMAASAKTFAMDGTILANVARLLSIS